MNADVLIVGTGAGGGTLAYRLALAGRKVLIVERGPFLPREKENWDTSAVFVENRYHTKDVWQDHKGKPLHPGTGYFVGGNTKVYGAALFRLREKDFGELKYKDGISPAWPVKYETFEPYYTQAEKLYHVHGKQGIDPTEPYRSEEYPFAPISNEPHMQGIEDDLKKIGLKPFPCPLGLKRNERNLVESPCIRCNTCDGFPCLVHAKADSDIDCIRRIMHLPNVTLMTETKVTRLLTSESGRSVTGVEVEIEGSKSVLKADIYALCAGAINSAALLLLSGNDKHPKGLANSSDQVGRNFMFHKANTILALNTRKTRANYMKTFTLNDFYFGCDDYPFPMGNIQPVGSIRPAMMKADAPFFTPDFVLEIMAARATPWWLTTEDLPDPDNRVRIENGKIRLDYTPNNDEPFRMLTKKWIDILKQTGHSDSWFWLRSYFKKQVALEGVGHQNGTCRFGEDPRDSVLDTNCRTHDVDNLYVVDGAFFRSSGAVNPSLTIVANALRVGDHLIERLGKAQ